MNRVAPMHRAATSGSTPARSLPRPSLPTRPLPTRALLLFALLALAGAAHAAGEPVHHSAGGSCPSGSADAPADEAADEAGAGPTSQRADPATAQPAARARSGGGERARSRLRWHSFVPGMFK